MMPTVAPRRSPRRVLLLAALLATALVCCGSSQSTGPEPEVALASSAEAQSHFRALRQEWVSSPLDARVALERSLTDFVQRHPSDPQGRWVRIYLAWIDVQRGKLDDAGRWLALAEPGPAGAASDLYGVVRAALRLAKGDASQAYRELVTLSGRLIDPDDRLLCLDQLVLAALADRRYREAVRHTLELSAQAARRHRERMWRALELRLASIPLPELEASLPSVTADQIQSPSVQPAERAAAVDWMRRTMLDLLSRSAIDQQNVALAQRLVATAEGPRSGAEGGSELLLLATRGTLQRTVSGRTVGLAIELADAAQSQRSIDVASGIALTLDLSAPARGDRPIVLSTRQVDRHDVADALMRLTGDGASLLIAGLDAKGARAAADFARETAAPVLLLHEPSGDPADLPPSVFVLGSAAAPANEVLFAALEQRFRGVVRVGAAGTPCPSGAGDVDALSARASGRRLRLQFDADPSCTRGVLMHLGGAERPLALGFGLDSLGVAWESPPADEVWAVGAGRLPRFEGERDELATRWYASKGRPPTWYEGLGHDAARIASEVLGPAPDGVVRDAERVRARYAEVTTRLASERWSELWTSNEDRFDRARRLPRQFHAERLTAPTTEGAR